MGNSLFNNDLQKYRQWERTITNCDSESRRHTVRMYASAAAAFRDVYGPKIFGPARNFEAISRHGPRPP